MTNSKIKLLFPVVLFTLGLSACGSKTPSESSKTSESQTSETSQTSESSVGGKVTVRFWHTFGQKIVEALNRRIEKFQKAIKDHDGVDVEIALEYQGGYDDMVNKITLGLGSGDSPTLAVAYPDHITEYFDWEDKNIANTVVNLDKFIDDDNLTFGTDTYYGDKEDVDDIVPAFLDEGRQFRKEGTYVMPFMKSSEVMFYNLDAAKRAMPFYDDTVLPDKVAQKIDSMTWDELLEFGKVAYEHKDEVLSTLKYSIAYDSDSNLFISKMFQNEIPFTSIDANGKGVIDFAKSENLTRAKQMVSKFSEAHKNHVFTTKGAEGTYTSNLFQNYECIFTISSSGGTGYTLPSVADAFDCEIVDVPASNNNPLYVSQGPSLAMFNRPELAKTDNDKAVLYGWKFLKFLTSTEINVEMCIRGSEGYIPVRESSYTTEAYLEYLEDPETGLYGQTAKVLFDKVDGHYLNSKVFKGSATVRNQVGAIVTGAMKDNPDIDNLFAEAINAINLDL